MSSTSQFTGTTYEDAPAPLTDRERTLLKRIFSDFFEVPGEWLTSLGLWLEANPPILGKSVLGGQVPALKPDSVLSIHILDGSVQEVDLDPTIRARLHPQMISGWDSDKLPTATGNGPVVRVPYVSGVATVFTLKRAFARVETPGAGATVFKVEKSTSGGAFTPTLIETLTIPAAGYSIEDTAPTAWTVTSGNELRLVFDTLGTTGAYQVQLQWES